MPPRRASSSPKSSLKSLSSSSGTSVKRKVGRPPGRRQFHWHNDGASKHARSSLDVLLAWLTTPGNYSRWAARSSSHSSGHHQSAKSSGEGRLHLCKEVNALLQREGIAHRKDMDVYAKIVVIEKSFHAAKKWLEETALMPKFLSGTAGKDVDANVNQLCRHYKELAPAFAATNNETAAAEVVDVDGDDDEDGDGGDNSDSTTSTDDAEEKPRAIENEEVAREERALVRDETVNESIDEIFNSQSELYTLSPVHGETPCPDNTSPQKEVAENRASRVVTNRREQEDEYEETKENGPPEPDPQDLLELQRSSPGPLNQKRIRQRIASQLSDDEAESASADSGSAQKQQGTLIAPPSASTFTKVLVTVQRSNMNSPAREKTATATRQIEKPSIAPKRKTSGLLRDAIAATSAELSPPSAHKKQKTQWTEQQELKKQQQELKKQQQLQIEQEEEQLVEQLQQEYHKKTQLQRDELKKKKQQQEELKKKKLQLHQEELKKKHQQRQEELSKKKQQEHERKKQQELDDLMRKNQRREELLMKKQRQEEEESIKKQQELEELQKRQQRRESLLAKKKQQEGDELNEKKQSQQEEKQKKASAVSIQPISKTLDLPGSQRHPDELKAIIRACEEEREQRHTLFQLQCDKLLQELEEKKIKVVYETALARRKLLEVGVEQSEVDRILPL